MIIEGTFSEDGMSQAELDSLTRRLQALVEQRQREQAAFDKGVEVGRQMAEYQELPY